MDRDEILAAIRRAADQNHGRPVGRDRLERVAGVTEYALSRHWSTYGDAVLEAGLQPNVMQGRTHDSVVLDHFIELTEELGRVPTTADLTMAHAGDGTFPSKGVFDRFGSRSYRIERAWEQCRADPAQSAVAAILESARSKDPAPPQGPDNESSTTYGFVYLARGHVGEYKIGRTNLVDRRLAELGTKSARQLTLVHEIKTDDPVGVERYWHQRFATKNMRGEWFSLSAADVAAFRRWRRVW